MQIINEEIRDLLVAPSDTNASGSSLSVREDGKRGIMVAGLTEHAVESIDQVVNLLQTGMLHRATASTGMNAQSSRSHAICTLTMEHYDMKDGERSDARFSKFHLVDLAGSERVKRTKAKGARFKEGVFINRGLLSLGNVINALSERSRRSLPSLYVPYRDSKLTRLLQDSLGGNSKTLMLACVSPADVNFEETSSSLRYAYRARSIENKAVVNKELSPEQEVLFLKQQLEVMQLRLLQQEKHFSKGYGTKVRGIAHDSMDPNQELVKWKKLAQSREQEVQIVMNASKKWKKAATEFLPKDTPTSSMVLFQEALEFEKSISLDSLLSSDSTLPIKRDTPEVEKEQLFTPRRDTAKHKTALQRQTKDTPDTHQTPSREQKLKLFQQKRQEQRKEIGKPSVIYSKQSPFLKRKSEEFSTTQKRMRSMPQQSNGCETDKPMLAKRKLSQASNGENSEQWDIEAMDRIMKLINSTFETQLAIIGAKIAIRKDLEERTRMASELSRLELKSSNATPRKLANLKMSLGNKNSDIQEMQHKLASVERDYSIPQDLFPAKSSLCHDIIKYLMEATVESRLACMELEQCIPPKDAKIAELEAELQSLREQTAMKKKATPKKKPRESLDAEELPSSSDEENEPSDDDSDYIDEEEQRRSAAAQLAAAKQRRATISQKAEEQSTSASTDPAPGCCLCQGKCATKACACRAVKQKCGADCSCSAVKCHNRPGFESNRKTPSQSSDALPGKENDVPSTNGNDADDISKKVVGAPAILTTPIGCEKRVDHSAVEQVASCADAAE